MKDDRIPDHDHIARYCKPTTVVDGEIQASAFKVRKDEESLSVNWLEFLRCSSREQEITELRKILVEKLKVKSRAKIAVINVGVMCEKVLTGSMDSRKLEVRHNSSKNDPSHSGIYNLREDDELIAELILETVNKSYPVQP